VKAVVMAEVDSIRVFRGIYGGFALAMSEAESGIHFDELPSSDEMASRAFELTSQVVTGDQRDVMPGAQQEFTATTVALAIIEHNGKSEELSAQSISDALDGLWTLVGGRWSRQETVPSESA
jgi:hypothetical protein